MISVCHNFINWTREATRQLWATDPVLAGSPSSFAYLTSQFPRSIPEYLKNYDPTRLAKLEETMSRYEYNFHHHLQIFLDIMDKYAATESVGMTKLCAQLSSIVDKGKVEKAGKKELRPLSAGGGG